MQKNMGNSGNELKKTATQHIEDESVMLHKAKDEEDDDHGSRTE